MSQTYDLLNSARKDSTTELSAVGLGLDVCTALIALVIINIVALSFLSFSALLAAAILVCGALATTRRPRIFVSSVTTITVSLAVFLLLPLVATNTAAMIFITLGFWTARFAVVICAAIYVSLTVSTSDLVATLYRLKAPNFVTVPFTVMLRFIPQARLEFLAIAEAMSLRGIPVGTTAWLKHPLRTIEYLLVPMLVSASRLADDLTASGLVRGLGGKNHPTPLRVSKFTWRDLVAIVVLVALFGYGLWSQGIHE